MKSAVFIFFMICSLFANAQAPRLQQQFSWSQNNRIIQTVAISAKGDKLVFVKRVNPNDSIALKNRLDEDRTTENLLPGKNDSLHSGDPVVSLVNTANKHLTLIDYGWSPHFSPEGGRVVYAHQSLPVAGKKITAAALKGNDIKIFSIKEGKAQTVAAPQARGFLLDPVFTDSSTLFYKTGDAVNGPYAGAIALNRLNLLTKKTELLRSAKIRHRLYDLVGNIYGTGNNYSYIVYSPQDSTSGLASEYEHLLLHDKDTVQDFGIRRFTNLEFKFALLPKKTLVYLDDNHLMTDDTSYIVYFEKGKTVSKKPINFEFSKAWLSPDGTYMAYLDSSAACYVLRLSDFSRTPVPLPKKEIYSLTWSDNGQRLAIVQEHPKIPKTDMLYLFTVE
ncbi:MAG: hypothetical protein J7539_01735 [Niabella sp.]|nr:hypothetical protein [Niabella sp.]